MPATPLRSHAFSPAPSSSDLGIMPDLYRLSVGPVHAAYYQQHFLRFESQGKASPTWNHGAAFFTLAWLLLRKLWRPAAIYAGLLTGLLLVWWQGIHNRVPLALEAVLCAAGALLLCVVPGLLGNALYYHHVRNHTLATLGKASSLAQARVMLSAEAPTKERLNITAAVQALVALAIIGAVVARLDYTPHSPLVTAPSGPPAIVIPSVESLRAAQQSEAIGADTPLALSASASAPLAEPALTLAVTPAHAGATEAPTSSLPDDDLSIVQFAQAVPDAASAALAGAAATTTVTTAAKQPVAATKVAPTAAQSSAGTISPAPPPAAKQAPASAKKAVAPASSNHLIPGKFYLNAGVYAQATNVDNAVKRLHALRLQTVRQTVPSNKGTLTRLRIGPFDTRQQAQQAASKAKQLRIETSIFQQPR